MLFECPHEAPEARETFYNQMAIVAPAFTRLDFATSLKYIMDPKAPKELDGSLYTCLREVDKQLRL